jgi:hypothetical protein
MALVIPMALVDPEALMSLKLFFTLTVMALVVPMAFMNLNLADLDYLVKY